MQNMADSVLEVQSLQYRSQRPRTNAIRFVSSISKNVPSSFFQILRAFIENSSKMAFFRKFREGMALFFHYPPICEFDLDNVFSRSRTTGIQVESRKFSHFSPFYGSSKKWIFSIFSFGFIEAKMLENGRSSNFFLLTPHGVLFLKVGPLRFSNIRKGFPLWEPIKN